MVSDFFSRIGSTTTDICVKIHEHRSISVVVALLSELTFSIIRDFYHCTKMCIKSELCSERYFELRCVVYDKRSLSAKYLFWIG